MIDRKLSNALDGLRGIAAVIVFIAHFNKIYNLPITGEHGFYHLFPGILASYAVMIFFILSGFVITASIMRNIEKNNRFSSSLFLKKRLLRIYPPFIFSLILSLFVYWVINEFNLLGSISYRLAGDLYIAREKISIDGVTYLKNIFMLHGFYPNWGSISNNGPLWSVAYEWWIYIMVMFLATWLTNKSILKGALPLAAIVFFLLYTENTKFVFFISIWCIGAFSALMYFNGIKLQRSQIITLLIALLVCLAYTMYENWKIITPYNGIYEYVFQFFAMIFLTLLMIFKPIIKVFNLRIFIRAAKFSYTLYVIHFPLLLLSFSFLHEIYSGSGNIFRLIIFILVFGLVTSLSYVISSFVENRKVFEALIPGKILRWIKNAHEIT
jgi:peptidoglycan/LPS O-acetylase OafA/YrhL